MPGSLLEELSTLYLVNKYVFWAAPVVEISHCCISVTTLSVDLKFASPCVIIQFK